MWLCLSLEGKLLKEVLRESFLGVVQRGSLMVNIYCLQSLFRVPFLSQKEKSSASGRWFFFFFVLPIFLQCSGQIEPHKPGITKSRHLNVSDFFFFLLGFLEISCWNIFLPYSGGCFGKQFCLLIPSLFPSSCASPKSFSGNTKTKQKKDIK